MSLVRHPDGRQVTAAQQPGQLDRIALVRLDSIAGRRGISEGATTRFCTPSAVS